MHTADEMTTGNEAQRPRLEGETDILALVPRAADIETPLAAADEAALEAGIASLFEALLQPEPDEVVGPFEADVLLAELNRLWAQPLAA